MQQQLDSQPITLNPAQVSFAVAIIPSIPLREQISRGSLAIARLYDSSNIIDNVKFPAHISLYLGGNDMEELQRIAPKLELATRSLLSVNLRAERIYTSHGFIGLAVQKNEPLRKLFNIIFEICTEMHRVNPRYRPHLIERWPRLRRGQQSLLAQHGTYKTFDALDLHLSIAQVDDRETNEALRIGQKNVIVPQEFRIECLQLVNIGHKNEHWDILYQWHK